MTWILIIALVILMGLVLYSLIRGIVAFLQSTKIDLETGKGENSTERQLLQNKMMFNRIKYQAAAVLVCALLLAMAR